MRTSLSRKDLRSERLNQSPYARPARGEVRRSASHSAFSPLSSLVNFVSAPFRKSTLPRHSQDADGRILEDDQRSVSGSEDGWNGEPPTVMEEVDVFSLASAAGRAGPEFEARAQSWRASKGLLTQNSRGIRNSTSSWELLSLDEGRTIRPSPSMPAFHQSARRTPAQKASGLPSRPAIPGSYLKNQLLSTPKAADGPSAYSSSPSSVALRSFLDAKGDEPINAQDVDVLESLTRNLRAEARRSAQPVGGWSAGTFAATPLPKTGSPRSTATPESSFSIGTATQSRFLPASSKRQVTYLGPGMSARRLNPKPKQTFKPLFTFDDEAKDDVSGKKRKVDLDANQDKTAEDRHSPADDAAASAAAQFNAKVKSRFAAPGKPSPLSQAAGASPQKALSDDIVKAGKKRAADIMQDLFDAEVGPIEPAKPTIVFNPYEESSVVPTGKFEASRSSLRKSASAMRASLRSSSVAKRGAAEKIERLGSGTPGRKLSTLELVSGFKPSTSTSRRSESPEEEDEIEVDEVVEQPTLKLPEPVRPAPPVAAKPVKVPEPDTYQPFNVPSLSSSTLGKSTSSAPKAPEASHSAVADSVIAASKPAPAPVFKPTPIGLGPPPAAEPSSAGPSTTTRSASRRVDPSAIYLSAKDSALNVDKAALPFYTFNLPSSSSSPEPSAAVKAALRKDHSEQTFVFTLSKTSVPSADLFSPPAAPSLSLPKAAAAGSEWECDTCMLKNPDSAKEQCQVCEAPRPGIKAAAAPKATLPAPPAPPAAGGFAFGGSATSAPAFGGFAAPVAKTGEWDCDTCMLKNPDSAKEKCTVCEMPRPGQKAAAPAAAAPPALPAVPAGGFAFKAPAASAGQWECGTCNLQNPDSAKEQCTVCEAPRPGASAPPAAASQPPAALPAPPAGGFSFGGKPPAPPSGGFAFGGGAKPSAPASGFGGFKPTVAPASSGFTFGGSSSGASSGGFTPSVAPPSGGFGGFGSFGKSSAPATAPAASTGAQWTCDTCMLQNPDSAKEQCTVCEAPRPK
ncbi:hypothetical protein Q8F55_005354 [Vanrija albida]|uniref:RanBP2-type domain-containing protein n=1 Tax=Vanrija albida TaxID=181172 RepID=A0ABR3Q1V8_9TREE